MTAQQLTETRSLYLDGSTDAAMGESPQNQNPEYLNGYLDKLRSLIQEGKYTLQIQWLSRAYLSGGYDGEL